MVHQIHTQLIHHLRRPGNTGRVDVVLTLPAELTAHAPVWSPEPSLPRAGAVRHVEVSTATVWAKPLDGLFHVIAHYEDDDERDLMVSGVVDADTLLGPQGIHTNPGRLATRAALGTADSRLMAQAHPLMIYRRWVRRWEQEILWQLQRPGMPYWDWHPYRVQRVPDGNWQVAISLLVEDGRHSNVVWDLAKTLHHLVRFYGPRTRMRVCEFDPTRFDGPLHTLALDTLTTATPPVTAELELTG